MPLLFVYGTLRTPVGGPAGDTRFRHRIDAEVRSSTPAILPHADLFDLGAYPGVRPGSGTVVGEVLDLTDAGLEICDVIEGHPDFYERTEIDLEVDGATTSVWVYWAPEDSVLDREPVASGDWFERPRGDGGGAAPSDPAIGAALDRFAAATYSWIATMRTDGRPHSVPMWHVVRDGRIWFATPETSVKVANLEVNPNTVVHLPDPEAVTILDGWAIARPEMLVALSPAFVEKYEWDPSLDAGITLLEVTPVRATSWSDS